MHIRNCRLDQVLLDESPYCYTDPEDLDGLARSIAAVGLLQPPLAAEVDGSIVIVAGFRRLRACRQLGMPSADVSMLAAGLSPDQLFRIAILSNAAHRRLNPVECGRLCRSIEQRLSIDRKTLAREFLPLMGQPAAPERLELLRPIPDLPPLLIPWVAAETFPLKNVPGLLRFQPEDREFLAEVMVGLRFSSSRQREFLQQIWDIHRREELPVRRILEMAGARVPAGSDQRDLPRLSESVWSALHRLAFPHLARRETVFEKANRRFEKIPGVRLLPFPYFEKSEYRLELVFDSPARLQSTLRELAAPGVESAAAALFAEPGEESPRHEATGHSDKRSSE